VHQDSRTLDSTGPVKYLSSPTLLMSLALVIVYGLQGLVTGSITNPLGSVPLFDYLVQCDVTNSLSQPPLPVYPWTLLTSIFLHASLLHVGGNVLFLLIFGLVLEEQVSRFRWLITFLATGLAGSLSFAVYDVALFFLAPPTSLSQLPIVDCGVGASAAVYGILGAGTGLRGAVFIIFIAGLDIAAGGAFIPHLGGLITGLILRKFWTSNLLSR